MTTDTIDVKSGLEKFVGKQVVLKVLDGQNTIKSFFGTLVSVDNTDKYCFLNLKFKYGDKTRSFNTLFVRDIAEETESPDVKENGTLGDTNGKTQSSSDDRSQS